MKLILPLWGRGRNLKGFRSKDSWCSIQSSGKEGGDAIWKWEMLGWCLRRGKVAGGGQRVIFHYRESREPEPSARSQTLEPMKLPYHDSHPCVPQPGLRGGRNLQKRMSDHQWLSQHLPSKNLSTGDAKGLNPGRQSYLMKQKGHEHHGKSSA